MPRCNIKLSVIVPAYNVEDCIGDALDSIAAQKPPFDEIIIINDGSSDNTLQAIQGHPCSAGAHVITTQNKGLGPARNKGIEQASGDYIYFLDSDDVLDHVFTQTIHNCIHKDHLPDLILFSGKQFLDKGSPEIRTSLSDFKRGCVAHGIDGEEAIVKLKRTDGLLANSYLYISKRALWERESLRFQAILHEDEEVLYPLILAAKNVSILEDALNHRRVRPDSIMSSAKTKAHSDGLRAAALTMTRLYHCHETDNKQVRKKIRQKAIRHACRYMRTCHKAGVPTDFRLMFSCARMLRSPDIVLGAIGTCIKQVCTHTNS